MTRNMKKLTYSGILIALAVVCSAFYIPVGPAKCFPIQHMVNVLAAVMLGPASVSYTHLYQSMKLNVNLLSLSQIIPTHTAGDRRLLLLYFHLII